MIISATPAIPSWVRGSRRPGLRRVRPGHAGLRTGSGRREAIDDKPAALSSAYRLLKPGGKPGITTGDRENLSGIKSMMKRLFARPPYAGRVKTSEDASKPVTREELKSLLSGAGFVEIEINLKEGKRYYSTPEEVFAFNEASSFGNFLRHVPENLQQQARKDLAEELEKCRTEGVIELAYNTLYAIARKPAEV